MRFYATPHPVSCGIDWPARTMDACLLDQHGARRLHRHMPARPETLRKAIAPSREDMVIAVACLLPWSWLADLWAQAGRPFVLGHALSRKAIHGGQATHDTIDAQTIAGRLRGHTHEAKQWQLLQIQRIHVVVPGSLSGFARLFVFFSLPWLSNAQR